jgi:hypothetical protein
LFAFNKWTKAQQIADIIASHLSELADTTCFDTLRLDTIFFNIPELKVNNDAFLRDLDMMLQKSYLSCEEEFDQDSLVYIIKEKRRLIYGYLLTITKLPLEFARHAKGFFKINDTYFFVEDIFPDNSEEFFAITNNSQQFYYLKPIFPPFKIVVSTGSECVTLVEYRYGYEKLFFIESYWSE